MGAGVVVVGLEIEQFVLQLCARPEQCMVQTLASNSADEPFDEGMRQRNVGDGLDFCHFQDPQIGLPLVGKVISVILPLSILAPSEITGQAGRCCNRHHLSPQTDRYRRSRELTVSEVRLRVNGHLKQQHPYDNRAFGFHFL
jgi:hypothetical protein